MWFSLANGESAVSELRSKMTETQILEAERITQEWRSRHPEPQEFLNSKSAEIRVQP
jgi:hypothetical protein